jgi:hypothetical protein
MRQAYFGEDPILRTHDAQIVQGGHALHVKGGWEFASTHGVILNEPERIQLARKVRTVYGFSTEDEESESILASGRSIHLPSMVFKESLTISNGSFVVSLSPHDAIISWASQHTQSALKDLKVVKVPFSGAWAHDKSLKGLDVSATSTALLPDTEFAIYFSPVKKLSESLLQDKYNVTL